MKQLHKNWHLVDKELSQSARESEAVKGSNNQARDKISDCQLWIDNKNGLIFSSSVTPISGTVEFPRDHAASYSIVILDENSDEIARIGLSPEKGGTIIKSSFTWNLKSRLDSYVKSGRYTISLVELSKGELIERCSVECMVADTRDILSLTDSLKRSKRFSDHTSQRVLSIYVDIIKDIEILILERLKDNRFDEPYFVARTTAGFIQQIYNDIDNDSASQFRALIEEFVSRNPKLVVQSDDRKLGLWTIFDFLVNYMADLEDRVRANAMVKCGYSNFTLNDRDIIVSALVPGILPHCKTFPLPKNAIGRKTSALVERLLKYGIRYLGGKHIDKSISICRATLE